jgi:hypothetical protein
MKEYNIPHTHGGMEQFITEIESYCAAKGIAPQKLLRDVLKSSWRIWDEWKSGKSSPTLASADRVRAHMAQNPAPARDVQDSETRGAA